MSETPSIINVKNIDTTKQPLFFGEPLGLQRYDNPKYKKIDQSFADQLSFFWRPNEIDITLDGQQFRELTEDEQFIFTQNLAYQTTLDSCQSRGIPHLIEHVSNPELEAAAKAWEFYETIHSFSYTYIIKNVYSNPSEVFDNMLETPELLQRATSVTKQYDDLINSIGTEDLHEAKKKLYLTLISINILEGIRFYVSFVCSYAFAERGKMMGNSQIIGLINRDENCLTKNAQALTPSGWKYISELTMTDKIAQFNKDKTISFVIPNKIIKKKNDSGKVIRFYNKLKHVDMTLTENHRIIYENGKTGEILECLAKDFKPGPYKNILVGSDINNSNIVYDTLSDYDRFRIAFQADGSFRSGVIEEGKHCGYKTVSFTISKKRKKDRLLEILQSNEFEYKIGKDVYGQDVFKVKVPVEYELSKQLDWVPELSSISHDWAKSFIAEVSQWDGYIRNDCEGILYYSSIEEYNVEIVQTLAVLCGYRTHKSVQSDNRKDTYSDVHRLSIVTNRSFISGQTLKVEHINYEDDVVCVNVDSGMFLAKQEDSIFVTGNCHLALTQNILNYLRKNEDEGFQEVVEECEDTVYQMYLDSAKEEMEWAHFLFKDRSMIGLNAEILIEYMKHITGRRMRAIGLKDPYGIKTCPINWVKKYTDSKNVQEAPQEIEKTSYLSNSIKNDASVTSFDEFDF